MTNNNDNIWGGVEIIHAYTRAQAIEDGELVDVTETANEAGWRLPVALTRALWGAIEAIPANSSQDVAGRLWDVLWMGKLAARNETGSDVFFKLHLRRRGTRQRLAELRANIGPGDNGEAVVTIGFPGDF